MLINEKRSEQCLAGCKQSVLLIQYTNIYLIALDGVAQWIEHGLQTRGSPVQFPLRAYAWVAGQDASMGCMRSNHTLIVLSPSFSFSSSLPKDKKIKSLYIYIHTHTPNIYFLRLYLFLEREGRDINVWLPFTPTHLGTWPSMCPDWELNWQPFGLQASTQSTEPHQPGHKYLFETH